MRELVGASEAAAVPVDLGGQVSGQGLAAAIATERERRTYGRCIYCSTPCYGLACRSHRDLLTLDPHQYEMRLRGANEKGI